jgi:hypothetical protein
MQQAIVGFHLDEENIGLLISPVVMVSMCAMIHRGKIALGC